MRILVVEDNMAVASMIISALEQAGYGIAGHGRSVDQSLKLVAECNFDVAILDVDLMGLNSGPVAEELKNRNLPFLVITGAAHLRLPAHHEAPVVLKPFRIDDLVKAVSDMKVRHRSIA